MINGTYYVTLATDASTNHKISAGLAFYLRDDTGSTRKAVLTYGKYNSTEAEWLALRYALDEINNRDYPDNTVLIYYCDNMTMINIVKGDLLTKKFTRNWGNKVMWARPILNKFQSVDARHVKSHTNKKKFNEPKYYLNRWCDYNARSMLRHQRLHEEKRWNTHADLPPSTTAGTASLEG